ncbi:two-component sensor histidine kinase [Photobacterium frigidiphilum]|uniref:histidine kinase n=1 Tax=Photobacterium frigidiphilum TaxID=264736 RepID=A0A2T3JK61_9GAMM|nr:ATP-binding protein [Photobacterium frigidiphilum]PSU49401.1 two-component sensor histidine kinase [Photobacterium frigidiphilum]
MIKRILPSSLIGKICIIMVLGLVFELLIALQIFTNERVQMLNLTTSNSTLERVAALVNVIDRTSVELHDEILAASQSSGLTLSLDNTAVVTGNQRADLSAQLARSFSAPLPHQVKIQSVISQQHNEQQADMSKMMRHMHMSMKHMPMMQQPMVEYKTQLIGSVKLSNNYWLNFSSAIDQQALRWSWSAIVGLILVALFTLSAMYWVVKRSLLPVKKLAVAAQKLGQERDFTPLELSGPEEILPTIAAFNQMQTQLSQFVDDRTKMLAAISHDLRTPITSMRLRLEFIEHNEDQKQLLKTLTNMELMIEATMNFARDDAQQEPSQTVELTSLLQTITDDYQDRGDVIHFIAANKVICRLAPIAFRRVIENLLNNSLCYGQQFENTSRPSPIELNCFNDEQYTVVQVCDRGTGIDESALEDVFKPFVRLEKARDTSSSSVGLGLSISRSIIQAHGGSLVLRNRSEGGLCAEIRLPQYHRAQSK